jgi:hypothetical protein
LNFFLFIITRTGGTTFWILILKIIFLDFFSICFYLSWFSFGPPNLAIIAYRFFSFILNQSFIFTSIWFMVLLKVSTSALRKTAYWLRLAKSICNASVWSFCFRIIMLWFLFFIKCFNFSDIACTAKWSLFIILITSLNSNRVRF